MKYINIRLILFISFVLLAATSLFAIYHASSFLKQQDGDLSKVNIAGRQRMLSQRMSKNALLLGISSNKSEIIRLIENDYKLFSKSNEQLLNGNKDTGMPPTTEPQIRAELLQLEKDWNQFLTMLKQLIETDSKESKEYIIQNNLKILTKANDVVLLFEKEGTDKISNLKNDLNLAFISSIVISIIILCVLFFFFHLALKKLNREMSSLSKNIKSGNLDGALNKSNFPSDFQHLIWEIGEVIDSFTMPFNEIIRVMEGMAKKRLGERVEGIYYGKFETLKDFVNIAVKNMDDALGEVAHAVQLVKENSEKLSNTGQTMAQGATEQASTLEEISSSITQINHRTQDNANNATEANVDSDEAKTSANKGEETMSKMLEAMNQIESSTKNIFEIIKTIEGISFQTNLLALNAAVESARAGKAGKGFAVVAEEVRNLAQKATEAADKTKNLITASQKSVEMGAGLAAQVSKQIDTIHKVIGKVSERMRTIAHSTGEEANEMKQVSQSLNQVAFVVQQNTNIAEESAAMSEELSSQSMHLNELIRQFEMYEQCQRLRQIKWTKDFSVKIERFDNEHKHLFSLIDQFINAHGHDDNERMNLIVKRVYDYTVFHFRNEEKYFEKYKYPQRKEHIKQHRIFESKVEEFAEKLRKEGHCQKEDYQFLLQWLSNHILKVDTIYHHFLGKLV